MWSNLLKLIILLACLQADPVFAQSSIEEVYVNEDYAKVIQMADSLLEKSTNLETARLYQLRADAWYYLGDLEQSLESYFMAIHAGEQAEVRNELLLVECYSHAGFCYREMGLYNQALPHYKRSLALAKSLKDSLESAQQYYNLGTLFHYLGDNDRAIELLDSAYQIDLAKKDTVALGFDLKFISELKLQTKDFEGALYYAKESILLLPEGAGNANSHANRVKQLGSIFLAKGDLDSANYYLKAAETEYIQINDQWRLASCWLEMAKLQIQNKNFNEAISYAEQARAFYGHKEENQYSIHSNNVLAMIYGEMLLFDKAYTLLVENESKCEQMGDIKILTENYKLQYELLEKMGKKDDASLIKEKYLALEDSLNENTNREQLNRLALQVKFDKLEQQNQILSQQFEAKSADLEETTFRLNGVIWLSILVCLGLLTGIVLIRTNLKKKNVLLEEELGELRRQIKVLLEGDKAELEVDLNKLNLCLNNPLTDREFEILRHAVSDLNNSQIAEKVFVSVNTVKYHLKNIYEKLGVSNRKQALEYIVKAN